MASSAALTRLRACCSCRVTQCLCCSLKAGVLTVAILSFVNACFAFAGEAVLYFDLASAVVNNLEGKYLPPGTKVALAGDGRVHGALIVAGVYALLSSVIGVWSVVRESLRAATIFFALQVVNAAVSLMLLSITWFTGALSITTILAQTPGIIINIYLVVVVNSYRQLLKERSSGSSRVSLPAMSTVMGGDGDDDDALDTRGGATVYRDAVVDVRGGAVANGGGKGDGDAALEKGKAWGPAKLASPPASASLRAAVAAAELDDLDEDDNDLGIGAPAASHAVVKPVGRRV